MRPPLRARTSSTRRDRPGTKRSWLTRSSGPLATSRMPVASTTFAEFSVWAKHNRYHVYGTSEKGAVEYGAVRYQRPAMLLMGSEREGLTPDQEAQCEMMVRLPMAGRVTSLNLAVATGVMLYAMRKDEG